MPNRIMRPSNDECHASSFVAIEDSENVINPYVVLVKQGDDEDVFVITFDLFFTFQMPF